MEEELTFLSNFACVLNSSGILSKHQISIFMESKIRLIICYFDYKTSFFKL